MNSLQVTIVWVGACAVCVWIGLIVGWMIGHEEGVSDGLRRGKAANERGLAVQAGGAAGRDAEI